MAVYKCLEKKYTRPDTLRLLSQHSGKSCAELKRRIKADGKESVAPLVERVIDTMVSEINAKRLVLKPIWYKQKVDQSSHKLRNIGIQDVKQQLYDYVAVIALEPILCRIGEYQCAALPGRGQSYGINIVKRWMRNNSIKYAAKADVRKCYESIDRGKLMAFLRSRIKNGPLLWLIETLISTFASGLSIGSYLSQFLCNLYLSQIYHYVSEDLCRVRKHKNGTAERINLVDHVIFYMDDILILGTNAKDLHKAMQLIIKKSTEMGLDIKPDWRVFKTTGDGKDDGQFIDMMGVRIYRKHTTIRARIFLRIRRAFKKLLRAIKCHMRIPAWLARRCIAYWGIIQSTDSHNLIAKYKIKQTIKICKKVVSNESKIFKPATAC